MSTRAIIDSKAMQPIYDADKTRNPHRIGKAIIEAIKENHLNLSFQQIETVLRDGKCFTYLIARDRKGVYTEEVRFLFPGDSVDKTYYLFITTLDKSKAMQEVLKESSTYEENFEKLKETGFVSFNSEMLLSKQIIEPKDTLESQDPSSDLRVSARCEDLDMTMEEFTQRADNALKDVIGRQDPSSDLRVSDDTLKVGKLVLNLAALASAIAILLFSKE